MKAPSLLVCIGAAALFLAPEVHAQQGSVPELLSQAQQAYLKGDTETAKRLFQAVNRMDPKNPTAIGFLRRIQAQGKIQGPATVEKQLSTVMVPKVEFRDATIGSALDYLKQVVNRTTEGKTSVNFIVQLPETQVQTQTVTMSITNVPFTEVLRYLGGLADLDFVYDKYAVVVKPKSAAVSSNTTPAPAAAQ